MVQREVATSECVTALSRKFIGVESDHWVESACRFIVLSNFFSACGISYYNRFSTHPPNF
jgi:hypothetical protein